MAKEIFKRVLSVQDREVVRLVRKPSAPSGLGFDNRREKVSLPSTGPIISDRNRKRFLSNRSDQNDRALLTLKIGARLRCAIYRCVITCKRVRSSARYIESPKTVT